MYNVYKYQVPIYRILLKNISYFCYLRIMKTKRFIFPAAPVHPQAILKVHDNYIEHDFSCLTSKIIFLR